MFKNTYLIVADMTWEVKNYYLVLYLRVVPYNTTKLSLVYTKLHIRKAVNSVKNTFSQRNSRTK